MRKVVQLLLAIVICGLLWVIYTMISTPIEFTKEKASKDKAIIERIKDIRQAQRSYKSKYLRFTGDFDTLINFVLSDSLEMERKIVDDDDSVALALLKKAGRKNVEKFYVNVIDTVFGAKKLSPAEIKELRYIPGTDKKVEYFLKAGTIATESKVVIPIVECGVPYIKYLDTVKYRQQVINFIDDSVNNFGKWPGIKFGSMEGGNNEAGNWE